MSHPPQSERRSSIVPSKSRGTSSTSTGGLPGNQTPTYPPFGLQQDALPRSAPALPSLATITGKADNSREHEGSGSPTTWRSFGVRNILNPTSEVPANPAPGTASSSRSGTGAGYQVVHEAPTTSPHIRKRSQPQQPAIGNHEQPERPDRRILTPRSPSLRAVRTASAGGQRSPSTGAGHIHRIPAPSGHGRGYTAEPGDNYDAAVPPLPPLSTTTGGQPLSLQPRDTLSTGLQISGSSAASTVYSPLVKQQDNRPDLGRQPYAAADGGPSPFHSNQVQIPHVPSAGGGGESSINYTPPTSGPVRSGLPYGQAEYQLTFETPQGSMVLPVNVDYQQASRLADEKRKRNAGASARFRQRRKEKEREANQTIAGLQQELQDVAQEREFYLHERNFFRDMLARSNPGPLPVRPHSPPPRQVRTASSVGPETSPSLDYNRQDLEVQGQSQRRRTGEYQPSLPSQSPSSTYTPSFPPSGQPYTLPALSAAHAYSDSRVGPPMIPHAPAGAYHFDSVRRNLPDRDWNGSR